MIIRAILPIGLAAVAALFAQAPVRPPQVVSPEVTADRSVVFRLFARNAADVKLSGGDIPGNGGPGKAMIKGEMVNRNPTRIKTGKDLGYKLLTALVS